MFFSFVILYPPLNFYPCYAQLRYVPLSQTILRSVEYEIRAMPLPASLFPALLSLLNIKP